MINDTVDDGNLAPPGMRGTSWNLVNNDGINCPAFSSTGAGFRGPINCMLVYTCAQIRKTFLFYLYSKMKLDSWIWCFANDG